METAQREGQLLGWISPMEIRILLLRQLAAPQWILEHQKCFIAINGEKILSLLFSPNQDPNTASGPPDPVAPPSGEIRTTASKFWPSSEDSPSPSGSQRHPDPIDLAPSQGDRSADPTRVGTINNLGYPAYAGPLPGGVTFRPLQADPSALYLSRASFPVSSNCYSQFYPSCPEPKQGGPAGTVT
ncbi:hypothetical protein AnigIFM56816_004319 [Aspergillus niger]|nr:hypothetical protein AnigIFM56816_004319 [Aspergillus niger]